MQKSVRRKREKSQTARRRCTNLIILAAASAPGHVAPVQIPAPTTLPIQPHKISCTQNLPKTLHCNFFQARFLLLSTTSTKSQKHQDRRPAIDVYTTRETLKLARSVNTVGQFGSRARHPPLLERPWFSTPTRQTRRRRRPR